MRKKAFTLVEVMIIVSIIIILAAIGIPNLLRARLTANDSAAQANLRTIAAACENYASANQGAYPDNISSLRGEYPPYLNEDYTSAPRYGFDYACELDESGYTCTATPSLCRQTGTKVFTIGNGAILTVEDCS